MIDWISVDEALPEPIIEHGEQLWPWVLIYRRYNDPDYFSGYYNHTDERWYHHNDYAIGNVQHWAKLNPP